MPPYRQWYRGRDAIRAFVTWVWRSGVRGRFRLVPTASNRQPAFAFYDRGGTGPEWRAHSIQILTLQDDSIASMTSFVTPRLFTAFSLPGALPTQGAAPPPPAARP